MNNPYIKKTPLLFSITLLAATTVMAQTMNTDPVRASAQVSVVARSTPDTPRNDTATIAELPDGTLMVVWHKYRVSPEGTSDYGHADIASKISTDGGRTWKDERIVVEMRPGDVNAQAPAICMLPNGDMLLAVMRAHARSSSSMCLYRSKDNGRSWQAETEIWTRSKGQWLQGGAAWIQRLSSGRLVLPFHGGTGDQGRGGQHNIVRCYLSDDDGRTWRLAPAVVDLPMRGAMEASIAELPDGRLIMSLRTQLGSVMICESRDGAETWSLPWNSGLTAPESCTCLRRVGNTARLMLLWNGCEFYEPAHHHFGQRTPLTLAISDDAGRTWRRAGNIEADPSFMYTNLNCTFTSKGDALITYWARTPQWAKTPDLSETRCALLPASFWQNLK